MSPCAHDSANQLIRENNQQAGRTYTWVYDNAGNIQSKNQYAYTTGTVGTASDTVNYSYDESQWSDLLTAYDGVAITYDQIGNPLSDGTRSYTWKQGHQLATLSNGASTWTNTYNADGLRTKRTNGTSTYSYVYNGSQLVQMTVDGNTLYFTYDASGTPQTVTYNGTTYYYATNLQGDITAILDSTGTTVVSYTYDAWGNHTSTSNGTGTLASTLGRHNPLRYRGYVYDVESELYYLQSRYYNPAIGRFINADAFASTGQCLLGGNVFTYCANNQVNYVDDSGYYLKYCNPYAGGPCGIYSNVGGNATGASSGTAGGGGAGIPSPVTGLTALEIIELLDTTSDIVDGFGNLSQAAEYGIKGYTDLRTDLSGTGLEAHHIVEKRFLTGQNMDTKTALSVAVTKEEHQKFTNAWRRFFPYGKTDYKALDVNEIWEAAKKIYSEYPYLLKTVWDTLF